MIQRMLAGGVLAGFAAGLLAAALHFWFVQPPLLLGEAYETGALEHFGGASHGESARHAHEPASGADEGAVSRNLLTVLFTGLIYVGYGLFLALGFQLAEAFGRSVPARDGVIWGLAGFAAFQMAPAMGLPPELPGTIAAEFHLRQIWWIATVIGTAAGLALLAFGRAPLWALAGVALVAAPHVAGAPHPEAFFGVAPPELSAEFAARSLGVGLVAWIMLGWLGARLWSRAAG